MLESILIRNFQKHEELYVEFDKNILVIIGQSDRGKSSFIRALIWLLTNRPSGLSFLRRGTKEASVTLKVDGHEITRIRSKDKNLYILDGQIYEAFGTGIPTDIESILNISPISLSSQLDPPYLFTSSPGEVARELNAVVSLDLIDRTLADIASESRKAKSTVDVVQTRLEAARQRKAALSWVKQANGRLSEIETLSSEINAVKREIAGLEGVLKEIAETQQKIDILSREVSELDSIVEICNYIIKLSTEISALGDILDQVYQIQEKIAEREAEIKILEVELEKGLDGKCPLCGMETLLVD